MKPKLTEADWKKALKKWLPKHNHEVSCRFCEIYYPGCKGCPIDMGGWRGSDYYDSHCNKTTHPWHKWADNRTEKNAIRVYDFIAKKYKEWKTKK